MANKFWDDNLDYITIVKAGKALTERQLTPAEGCVNFTEIDRTLNSAKQQFVLAARGIMGKQIDNLVEAATKVIEARDPAKVADLEIRYKTQMADAIYSVLNDMMVYGRTQVKRELATQKGLVEVGMAEPWPEPLGAADAALIKEFLRAKAIANANMMALQLKNYLSFEALAQIKLGKLDKAALLTGLLNLSTKQLELAAGYSVSEAFNYGRSVEAERLKDEWDRAQYSTYLEQEGDNPVCEVCAPLDGREWPMDAPEVDRYAGGNPECLGRGHCRCLMVYIAKAEVKATK